MLNTKYAPWPSFTKVESDAVTGVLMSNRVNYWTGAVGKRFEEDFAKWCGVTYAIAIANGTLAIEIALRALGIKEGDEVIVPPRTFMATASSVSILGAVPIFADIDLRTQNISAKSIKENITERTKAVICVHLSGLPCDMDAIKDVCLPHNIKIIEDCAQAHGAKYKGKSVGGLGDIAAWSFCQDKIMTTGGEGGMVTTNDEELFKFMWGFKDHGKSYDTVFNYEHPPGFNFLHESIGSNYRLTEMQSAIGLCQLRKVDQWVERRRELAECYKGVINKYGFAEDYSSNEDYYHAHYRYYAKWNHKDVSRDEFIEICTAKDIPIFQGSCPEVYLEKAFEGTISRPVRPLPNAHQIGKDCFMLLTHPTLTNEDVSEICNNLDQVLQSLSK